MSLYMLLIIIGCAATLALYMDSKAEIALHNNTGSDRPADTSGMTSLTAITTLTPFLILFYNDNFWASLFYLIPLYIYIFLLLYITEKINFYKPNQKTLKKLYSFPTGIIFTIIIYYIFFYTYPIESGQVLVTAAPVIPKKTIWPIWPYYFYMVMVSTYAIATIVDWVNKNDTQYSSILLLDIFTISTPFIPLFTSHYWWALLLGDITLIVFASLTLSYISKNSGGILTAFSALLIFMSILSMLIYGIRSVFF